ncbi:MAG: FtsX-like permease family protein [Blastocatellia bacterium]|nr:FtsX-like permease family protein [Blastocatellia bacterium]
MRLALGAQSRSIVLLFLKQGLRMTLLGMAIGLAGAYGLMRLLEHLLFGVSATDLPTFISVALLLAGVALLACWIPARRATKVSSLIALKAE